MKKSALNRKRTRKPYERSQFALQTSLQVPVVAKDYHNTLLALQPTAYWPMTVASGDLQDNSGNGLTATAVGSVLYGNIEGPFGDTNGVRSVGFGSVAASGYFSAGKPAKLSITGPFTVGAWIYLGAASLTRNYDVISSETFQGSGFLLRVQSGADILIRTNQAGAFTQFNGGAVVAQKWAQVIATFDGTTGTIYVNGVSKQTGALTAPLANVANFTISDNTGSSFYGNINRAMVFNRALSSAEITALYNSAGIKS